jgi:hypothetical protein
VTDFDEIFMFGICTENCWGQGRGNLVFVHIGTSASPTLHEAQISVGHLRFVVLVRLDVTLCNVTGTYRLHLQGRRRWKQQVFQKYRYLVYRTAWYHIPEDSNLQAAMDFEFFFNCHCLLHQTCTCVTSVELKTKYYIINLKDCLISKCEN